MPYKGGVQLLPETKREVARRSAASNSWIYWGLGITVVVLAVNIILSSYIQNLKERIAEQDGMLRTQEQSRDKDIEQELLAAERQSELMGQLLRSHVYWTQAFGLIGNLMQSGVSFDSFSATSEGVIEFSATAPSYTTVARQIASFTAGNGVQDIQVNGVQSDAGQVSFSGTITLNVGETLQRQRDEN